jgi:hypothetical protein
MNIIFSVIIFLILAVAARIIFGVKRRQALRLRPLPDAWRQIIEDNIPLYNRLPEDLKPELGGLIHLFLDEKTFIGCGGQEIDESIKVTIAADELESSRRQSPESEGYPKLDFLCRLHQHYHRRLPHHCRPGRQRRYANAGRPGAGSNIICRICFWGEGGRRINSDVCVTSYFQPVIEQ